MSKLTLPIIVLFSFLVGGLLMYMSLQKQSGAAGKWSNETKKKYLNDCIRTGEGMTAICTCYVNKLAQSYSVQEADIISKNYQQNPKSLPPRIVSYIRDCTNNR